MNKFSLTLTSVMAAGAFALSSIAPASADGAASTRTIIGAAALAAGIAIQSNVARKHAAANRVQGYTQSGATVYADGRVVQPDGTTYYPGNHNQSVACSNADCQVNDNSTGGYYGTQYNTGYNNGRYNNGNNNGQYNNGQNDDGRYNNANGRSHRRQGDRD